MRAFHSFVAGFTLGWVLFAVAAVASGCGTNPPTPTPPPGPMDAAPAYPFQGLVADCDADTAQSPSVLSPANSCLAQYNPDAPDLSVVDSCSVDLMTTWPADAIACAARALGIRAAISVAGGDAGAADRSVAPAARAWLLGHDIMFRN